MTGIDVEPLIVNTSEAARLLGYSTTQGRRYIKYLVKENLLSERYLPGINHPRYLVAEIESLVKELIRVDVPKFQ